MCSSFRRNSTNGRSWDRGPALLYGVVSLSGRGRGDSRQPAHAPWARCWPSRKRGELCRAARRASRTSRHGAAAVAQDLTPSSLPCHRRPEEDEEERLTGRRLPLKRGGGRAPVSAVVWGTAARRRRLLPGPPPSRLRAETHRGEAAARMSLPDVWGFLPGWKGERPGWTELGGGGGGGVVLPPPTSTSTMVLLAARSRRCLHGCCCMGTTCLQLLLWILCAAGGEEQPFSVEVSIIREHSGSPPRCCCCLLFLMLLSLLLSDLYLTQQTHFVSFIIHCVCVGGS